MCACFALRGSVLSALLRRFLGRISCCDRSSLSPLSPWSCSRAVVHSSRVRRCTRRALLRSSASRRFSAPSRLIVLRSLLGPPIVRLSICPFVSVPIGQFAHLSLFVVFWSIRPPVCHLSVGRSAFVFRPRCAFVSVLRWLFCFLALPPPSTAHIDQFVANLFGRLFDRTVDIFVESASDRGRARV